MRPHYDFSKLKRVPNPFPDLIKQVITIRLDIRTIGYFKDLALESGIPYQNLINLYLRDCALNKKKLNFTWVSETPAQYGGESPGTRKKKSRKS